MSAARAWRQFAQLAMLWRPGDARVPVGPGSFFLAVALAWLAAIAWNAAYFGTIFSAYPLTFVPLGFAFGALDVLPMLFVAWLATLMLQRPSLLWTLAAFFVLAMSVGQNALYAVAVIALTPGQPVTESPYETTVSIVTLLWATIAIGRLLAWADPFRARIVRFGVALLCALAIAATPNRQDPFGYFTPDVTAAATSEDVDADAVDDAPRIDSEAVLSEQGARVDAAVAAIRPGVPGQIDLFVVAFGGDAGENVFRNEVAYAAQLFGERFGATGRVLTLLNNVDTVADTPLATRTNLVRAMRGLAAKIDRDEDIVLLFVTSHGSKDHYIYVALEDASLNQPSPGDLAAALDASGARWRAAIISACYSGGFIPALKGDASIVITAARDDRTSFGCGADSEITYFGRAFLTEGLNETGDLAGAFAIAERNIERREKAEDITASYPQIAIGDGFAAQWSRWLATHPPGAAIPFVPVVPVESDGDGDDTRSRDASEDAETSDRETPAANPLLPLS